MTTCGAAINPRLGAAQQDSCRRAYETIQIHPVSVPHDPISYDIALPDEAAMSSLAAELAAAAKPRDLVALHGTLGMGKTSFARAFIRRLLGAEEEVPSPTFTLVQIYDAPVGPIWHFDLYRLKDPEEIWELGFEDALADGILLIEWPDRLGTLLPARRLDLMLSPGPTATARQAVLAAQGGSDMLRGLIGGARR
jgi:tRNA threonylcarbamoyladenosine biosynthesis protein TsaE